MIVNKVYLLEGKHYMLQGGDVFLHNKGKAPSWMNWNMGYVMHNGTLVGQNVKFKK